MLCLSGFKLYSRWVPVLEVTFAMCVCVLFFFQVTSYHFTVNNVQITVFDTPGLADGTGNEEEYLRKIKESVTDPFDVFSFFAQR